MEPITCGGAVIIECGGQHRESTARGPAHAGERECRTGVCVYVCPHLFGAGIGSGILGLVE